VLWFLSRICAISGALQKNMTENRTLLTEYAENGCEQSFRELTARYINLVYSTAVRLMDGDTHRAEDVVQTVFIDLARLGGKLSPDVMLGGWLHRRACHVAAGFIRSERRRQNRERQAAQMNALNDSPECARRLSFSQRSLPIRRYCSSAARTRSRHGEIQI